ncbi:MAG: T9SS type A sorting domain-containing protein [Paludibacteraceae bacterium]|nr:T9SS type A sorting domain-containing protein [Paludibacteraceae bacterium]
MKKFFSILPMLLCAVMVMAEKCLIILPIEGSEQATALSTIGHLEFHGKNVVLYDVSGNELGSTPADQIRKIFFANRVPPTPPEDEAIDNVKTGIYVYPNPTADIITVEGMDGDQTIRIYSLNGQLISASRTSDGNAVINVSGLNSGDYLLQVGAEIVKFIKK